MDNNRNFELEASPYLSFCVHSRNDNHGGDMYRRMKTCLMGFFEQAERHQLRSEIVLVDWNPPAHKPLLKDAYQWPKHSKFCTIRIILVPPSIHQRYEGWQKIPVHNNVAQNVAIQRARGKFALSSTIDVLLSDELVRFIALEKLDHNHLYRIDRSDVRRGVTRLRSLDEQLSYCQKNTFRIHRFDPVNPRLSNEESLELGNPFPDLNGFPALYTGGPGDFALMAKNRWHELRGFPETDLLGGGLDILLAYMAYISGAKVESLSDKGRLYHIDHDVRFHSPEANWLTRSGLRDILPEVVLGKLRLFIRRFVPAKTEIDKAGIKTMDWTTMAQVVSDMANGTRSFAFNDETWGLGEESLAEFPVTIAQYEGQYEAELNRNPSYA